MCDKLRNFVFLFVLLSQCMVNNARAQPSGMHLIDSGRFVMGFDFPPDTSWWYPIVTPAHSVFVSRFFMDENEVFKKKWDSVYYWALAHGYSFDNPGNSQDSNFPVYNINWYDAVKWCNARSEIEGLTPVYYTDSSMNIIYRTGKICLKNNFVKWNEVGYRLPTEAEWEKAARGNLAGNYYPWSSVGGSFATHLDGSKANFDGSNDPWEGQLVPVTPVGYYNGNQIPAGSDMSNGYGLYDMAGNVIEWTWDWFDGYWYNRPESSLPDPKGPSDTASGFKTLRGGSWHSAESFGLLCAFRLSNHDPEYTGAACGFRCVRSDPGLNGLDEYTDKPTRQFNVSVYPNPFNELVVFRYSLPAASWVIVSIYDATGCQVAILQADLQQIGPHELRWNGTDGRGRVASDGMYYFTFQTTTGLVAYGKLLLLK